LAPQLGWRSASQRPGIAGGDRRHRQAMAQNPQPEKSISPSVCPLARHNFLDAFLQLTAAAAWRPNVSDALVNRSGED
jgi:hypothetical protein